MKNAYSLRASRGPVAGCAATALIKSRPSCMPDAAARAGIVGLPFA